MLLNVDDRLGWIASVLFHVGLVALLWVGQSDPRPARSTRIEIEVRRPQPVIEKPAPPKPAPAPKPKPRPEPEPPAKKPIPKPKPKEVVDLTRSDPKAKAPPVDTGGKVGDVKPVFGVRKDAVRLGGSFKVRVGNTLGTDSDGPIVPPDEVDDSVVPVPAARITQMPSIARASKPVYPPQMQRLGVEGIVLVEVVIDAEGSVREARVVRSPEPGLNVAAVEAARKTVFNPAQAGDEPVAVRIQIPVEFRLSN